MRTSFFLLFFCTGLAYPYESNGQNAIISLNANNQTVSDVLEKIEKQSNYFFFYNNKEVDVNRIVSINVENKQIKDVLDIMFSGSEIKYSMLENSIILTNKDIVIPTNFKAQGIPISGTVTDSNGETLPGVNVVLKGTSTGVITLNGSFELITMFWAVPYRSF